MALHPYERLRSEELHRNAWCAVRRDRIRSVDGRERDYYVIDIPHAVTVVPVLPDGRLLMIRQYRHAVSAVCWEWPSGRVEPGEPPESAAQRELREETGYVAGKLTPLGRLLPLNGIASHESRFFLAEDLAPGPSAREDFEDLELAPLAPAEILALVARGEIIDGFALAGILRYLVRTAGPEALLRALGDARP